MKTTGHFRWFLAVGIFTALSGARAADTASVVSGNNQFAFDLYAKLASGDGNLFFSPYSISTALGMTWAGARGNTELQMAQVLHFEANQAAEHTAFGGLQTQLNAVQERKLVALNIANGLWAQQDHKFLPAFLNIAEKDYGAKVEQVDFHTGADSVRKDINDWVSDKTAGRIKDLVGPGALNQMTRLVLVNAIYFKGKWLTQFKASDTHPAPFKTAPDQSVEAPFMHQIANFGYAEADGLRLLELPYAGGDLSMVVVLPAETNGLKWLENGLTADKLSGWVASTRKQKVEVYLPKFTLTGQFMLGDTLRAMGMTDAFTPEADFSGMDGERDLYISAVIHKAFVDVNEEGTEAAAATAVTIRALAIARPIDIPIFRANHPFLFLIRDVHSGSILFLGRLTQPMP